MKKKIIIAIGCILLLSITIFIIAHSSKYGRVTRDDEKTILFVREERSFDGEYCSIKALDNYGNIYHMDFMESSRGLIESGLIFQGDIVGYVSVDEIMRYYNKIRRIKIELSYDYIGGTYTGIEPYITYYGIRYIDGEMEYLNLGSNESVANNQTAVKIAEWMEDWEWENK